MPLDTSIYSQLQPNLAMGMGDLVNKYVDQTQADTERKNKLSQLAQQGELTGLQLNQAKQQAADESAVRQAYQESGGDVSGLAQKLRAQGLHTQAAQLEKQQLDQQKTNIEFQLKRHEGHAYIANEIYNNPAQWKSVVENSVRTGLLQPKEAQDMAAQYSTLTPEQIRANAENGMVMLKDASAKIAEQQYPKPAPPHPVVIEENGRQIIVDANDPRAQKQFGPKPKQDNTLVAVVGADGVTPVLVPRAQAAGMTPAGGKGAAGPTQHIADAKESNSLLDQVEKIGPLATGSAAGNIRDILAGTVGQATEGAKAAAQMKVLGASLTAKVPKMSGPQSDKDVAMYKEAAGNIGNPNVPWEIKQSAIQTIREINNRQLSYGNDIGAKQAPAIAKTKSGATTSGW